MRRKKVLTYLLVFILMMGLTYYLIFSKHSFEEIFYCVKSLKYADLFVCLLLVFLYFFVQAIYEKIIFKSMNLNIGIGRCLYYSICEFFYNAITPGASGGQPITIYKMSEDKIPLKNSLITLILSTILFKVYLLFGAVLILIFRKNYVFTNGKLITIFFFLGIALDIIVIIVYLLLMYNKKIKNLVFKLGYKFKSKLFKEDDDYKERVEKFLVQYTEEARYIKDHKKELLYSMILVFVQRTLLFSITFVLYRCFGFSDFSYFDLVLLQMFVQICVEAIFLPGGTGVSEYVSGFAFIALFGTTATAAMLLFRSLSFYIPVIIVMIIMSIIETKRILKK